MSTATTFFSYSRTDSEFVLKLAKDLRNAGASLWLDQLDITPGSHWDLSIENALNHSVNVVAVLSSSSVGSTNVMDELSYAIEKGKTIIPILITDCAIPFRLKRLQYVDFREDYQSALKQLMLVSQHEGEEQSKGDEATVEEVPQQLLIPEPGSSSARRVFQKTTDPVVSNTVTNLKGRKSLYFLLGGGVVIIALVIWLYANKSGNGEIQINISDSSSVDTSRSILPDQGNSINFNDSTYYRIRN